MLSGMSSQCRGSEPEPPGADTVPDSASEPAHQRLGALHENTATDDGDTDADHGRRPRRYPARPTTGTRALSGFLGTRHCSGSFLKNGKAIGSTESFSADLSGHWLVMRHADEPPFAFDAPELWSYNAQKKVFIACIFDNLGGAREFSSPGWDGDRFVFERQPDAAYPFTYAVTADD